VLQVRLLRLEIITMRASAAARGLMKNFSTDLF
jgi:hypothetical protein